MKKRFLLIAVMFLSGLAVASFAQTPSSTNTCRIEETRLGPFNSKISSLLVNGNGRHWAYISRGNGKAWVVFDDKNAGSYDDIEDDSLTFSRDGKRLLYIAKNQKLLVVVDNKPVARARPS